MSFQSLAFTTVRTQGISRNGEATCILGGIDAVLLRSFNSSAGKLIVQITNPKDDLDAGDFDLWLSDIRASFHDGLGTSVPCGECRGCCVSSYFVQIKPQDSDSIAIIPPHHLAPAPGAPTGTFLMGFDGNGHCPMLQNGNCSIYAARPGTCKDYDCRVFAAAGIPSGGEDKSTINERVNAWEFQYATPASRLRHEAIKTAARFIRDNRRSFPGGRAPTQATEIAIVAIKVYPVFLGPITDQDPTQIATAIIEASREFEASVHPRDNKKTFG